MLRLLKSYSMPVAMLTGAIFYPFFSQWATIVPSLIFGMLFLTYCRVEPRTIRLGKMHLWLILIQSIGSIAVYWALKSVHPVLAQGAMICVLAPTATSAPVIAKMLNGNVESLTAYTLLCNTVVLVGAPLFFALINGADTGTFTRSFLHILQNISWLLLAPFVLAMAMRKWANGVVQRIATISGLSFYLWAFALIIVTAKTVRFIVLQDSRYRHLEIALALVALIICLVQFIAGRSIGQKYADTVAGGQGLGQKNTVLAIWMAQTFLNPLSSIAPGAYVIWQNTFNSYQVWRANRKREKSENAA